MNHLPFLFVMLLALNFSGKPAPVPPPTKKPVVHVIAGREEDNENIPWTDDRILNWDDFLCAPKTNSDAVASTSTSLGISYQVDKGILSYTITCNFSKHKSWGLLKTDYILAHEQGHFDITEIFARKLFKAMSEYQFNKKSFRKDVNDIYKQIVKEKEDMQAAYDGESDHSRNRKIQQQWMERIESLLTETSPWAAYP